jgi:GNAT superfamily N-acetyltransferase
MPPALRPMSDEDVAPAHALAMAAFRDLAERLGDPPDPGSPLAAYAVRVRHLLATDPGGAWVAERDGRLAGCALALLREGIWGLSLLVVDPAEQSSGVGTALLARARAYGEGARGLIVLASRDPRALRAYVRLGLDLHPSVSAGGTPRGVRRAPEVREMATGDREWLDDVGRAVRGAAHGDDLDALAAGGATVVVLPERGYAAWRPGGLRLLAARDDAAATALLHAYLEADGDRSVVEWMTSAQQWAIRACLDAGLELRIGAAVLTAGELGPMEPYLPNGAYL